MITGDEVTRLREENARLLRLLALYRKVAAAAGITLPADAPDVREFWRAVAAHVAETNGDALSPGD